jgi:hypothetical protein
MDSLPPWMDGIPFTLSQGRAAGLTDADMRRKAFERPFHGVRITGTSGRVDGDVIDRCTALRVVLPSTALFSHTTAARLWGMPLPAWLSEDLHVLVPDAAAVRRPGVIGWRRGTDLEDPTLRSGLPVTSPADTWAMLATMTSARGGRFPREWLVAIGDFLISGRRTRFGREPPLASHEDLETARRQHGSRRGAAALAWAIDRIRGPVDSPPETVLRLALVRSRLPEPVAQPPIQTAAGIRHPDLGYLDQGLLLEYLGDVHRTDRRTWLQDLQRIQLFEDAGYRVILVGGDDITPVGLPPLCARVRRAPR